jgi:hypothetical protein
LKLGAGGLGSGDGGQWLMNQGRAVFSQLISFLPDRGTRRGRRSSFWLADWFAPVV